MTADIVSIMSEQIAQPTDPRTEPRSARGQSLVEFALVLPMLLVLFLGVADFGRVFSAGIIVEALARDAADAVAGDQRLMEIKDPMCDSACRSAIYGALHERAADVACDEANRLLPTTDGGGECLNLIVVGSCIHDSDTTHPCGFAATESLPAGCDQIDASWEPVQLGPQDASLGKDQLRSVEVRVCYRFKPLYHEISLPIVSYLVPEYIYIEKARTFTVSLDY